MKTREIKKREHLFATMKSEEIREYFRNRFELVDNACIRAYSLMMRNSGNHVTEIRAQYIWLKLIGKMHLLNELIWIQPKN